MSLLMDALKKAEQEKREAAKKLLSPDDTAILDSDANQGTADTEAVAADESGEQPSTSSPADTTYQTSALDFTLAPIELKKVPAEVPDNQETRTDAVDPDEELTLNVHMDELSLESEVADPDRNDDKTREIDSRVTETDVSLDPDQTFHGIDLDTSQAANSGLYEDTIQGEPFKTGDMARSYDETLPGVSAAQLARDIGSRDQPTPVAAQTVFAATNTISKPSYAFRGLLISLCVLAVGSAVVFYYYSVTPVVRDIPSPMVARGVETIIHGHEFETMVPAEVAAAISSMNITGGSDPMAEMGTAAPEAMAETLTEVPVEEIPAPTEITEVVEETEALAVTVPETVPPASYSLPPVMVAPASMVMISRSTRPADEGRLVNEAFAAYQQGNYELAKLRYEQAYAQTPDNRDVLLGLAAIAGKNDDTARAVQLYTRLIRLNPLDNVARAALLSYQQGENIADSISTIRSMLFDISDQPSLYFSLGKLYAAQSRWSEAQQAFFDAYRLDTTNPDYALNLAISLDRMGQVSTALDYYNTALQLSSNTPAGFDPRTVAVRIRTLEARE